MDQSSELKQIKIDNEIMATAQFTLNYQVQYGMAVYLIGECDALGAWDLRNARKLSCHENNEWKVQIYLGIYRSQYKYFIAQYDNPCSDVLWESGPNRIFNIPALSIEMQGIEFNDVWDHRSIRLLFTFKSKINTLHLTGSTHKLGHFQETLSVARVGNQFVHELLLNITQDQEVYYEYSYIRHANHQKVLQNFNVNSIQTNSYERNQQVVHHQDSKVIYRFNSNIFYGVIPRTISDFQFIIDKNIDTVVEFVQEEGLDSVPFHKVINDVNYIRINLMALKHKHYLDYMEYLYSLMKSLISEFNTFFICNLSMKHLKRYLNCYKTLELQTMKSRILPKTLSAELSNLIHKS